MSSSPDLTFCNTCEFRPLVIDGYFCAMAGIDNMNEMVSDETTSPVAVVFD